MCVVSNIGDDWGKRWPNNPVNPFPEHDWTKFTPPPVSRDEFEALKKEVESLKRLLEAAKRYDEETGQPDCHMDDKIALIKKVAELVGVKMDDVF